MIKAIEIENFKGIGDPVKIEIKPITLLFGPNSAGKSTILHAFAYALELLKNNNVDARETLLTGKCVDLGGFYEMVHRHEEEERDIRLRFELDLSSVNWREELPVDEHIMELPGHTLDLSDMGTEIMSGWIELTVGYPNLGEEEDDEYAEALNEIENRIDNDLYDMLISGHLSLRGFDYSDKLCVLSYKVGIDEVWLAEINHAGALIAWNRRHPVLAWSRKDMVTGNSHGPLDSLFPELRNPYSDLYQDCDAITIHDVAPDWMTSREIDNNLIVFKNDKSDQIEQATLKRVTIQMPNDMYTDESSVEIIMGLDNEDHKSSYSLYENKEPERIDVWIGNVRDVGWLVHSCEFCRELGWDDKTALWAWIMLVTALSGQSRNRRVSVRNTVNAVPILDQPMKFVRHSDLDASSDSLLGSIGTDSSGRRFVEQLLGRLICGPAKVLRNYLMEYRYVGPMREIPSRVHQSNHIDWANGLAAWKTLGDSKNKALVDEVSGWLFDTKRFDTGYKLNAEKIYEVNESLLLLALRNDLDQDWVENVDIKGVLEEMIRCPHYEQVMLLDVEKNARLHPKAVGTGISQIIPVITALLAEGADVVQVEQPELHLHPTQQAVVGDLLIEGVLGGRRKQIFVETHSIHLILRILRRIRETHKGHPHENLSITPSDISILYVDSDDGPVSVFDIGIHKDGELIEPWPDDFFDQEFFERFA